MSDVVDKYLMARDAAWGRYDRICEEIDAQRAVAWEEYLAAVEVARKKYLFTDKGGK